jgi:hypothetical protein
MIPAYPTLSRGEKPADHHQPYPMDCDIDSTDGRFSTLGRKKRLDPPVPRLRFANPLVIKSDTPPPEPHHPVAPSIVISHASTGTLGWNYYCLTPILALDRNSAFDTLSRTSPHSSPLHTLHSPLTSPLKRASPIRIKPPKLSLSFSKGYEKENVDDTEESLSSSWSKQSTTVKKPRGLSVMTNFHEYQSRGDECTSLGSSTHSASKSVDAELLAHSYQSEAFRKCLTPG